MCAALRERGNEKNRLIIDVRDKHKQQLNICTRHKNNNNVNDDDGGDSGGEKEFLIKL